MEPWRLRCQALPHKEYEKTIKKVTIVYHRQKHTETQTGIRHDKYGQAGTNKNMQNQMMAAHDHQQPANISAALCPSFWIIWFAFPLGLRNQTSARHITGPARAEVQLFGRIRCRSWTSVRDLLYSPPGHKSIGGQGNAKQKCWPRNKTLQHNCGPGPPHDTCCRARLTEPKAAVFTVMDQSRR